MSENYDINAVSPRPWSGTNWIGDSYGCNIKDADGNSLKFPDGVSLGSHANEAHIVRCVNQHDTLTEQVALLREALGEASDLMDDVVSRTGEYTPDSFTTQPWREALAQTAPTEPCGTCFGGETVHHPKEFNAEMSCPDCDEGIEDISRPGYIADRKCRTCGGKGFVPHEGYPDTFIPCHVCNYTNKNEVTG